jgi:hypothetical protein
MDGVEFMLEQVRQGTDGVDYHKLTLPNEAERYDLGGGIVIDVSPTGASVVFSKAEGDQDQL